jgi:hypothetical protein
MKKLSTLTAGLLIATLGCADEPATSAPTNTPPTLTKNATPAIKHPTAPTITVQEMLVSGPPQLKLHSLAMMTQGNVKEEIDESFLPGLKACAEDKILPLRSVSARLLGEHFVKGKPSPNPQAVELLVKLAQDETADVRFNAVYYGLSQIQNKSEEVINLLIDIASKDRKQSLYDHIVTSLEPDRERVTQALDRKMADSANIAYYEIYKDLTGKKPANAEKYLEMPTSRPRLFIFASEEQDAEAFKSDLSKVLKEAGIDAPNLTVSGTGENYVLMLKTYIAKDHQTVEQLFQEHPRFKITQDMWLTPELEIQIDAMRKK